MRYPLYFSQRFPEPIPVRDMHGQPLFKIDQQSLRLDSVMAVELEFQNYLSLAFNGIGRGNLPHGSER